MQNAAFAKRFLKAVSRG